MFKKIRKKVHIYVSHNMCTIQNFVKSSLFSFPPPKREIFLTYIEHTYDRFLSFSHKSSKKLFPRETFDIHIETTTCTDAHFFQISLNFFESVLNVFSKIGCKCPLFSLFTLEKITVLAWHNP